ncbi:hypothetical protein GH733_019101 [Mirounga leonina]|nr:hypothetical protein GH733_019101 [Mirounga leonina]
MQCWRSRPTPRSYSRRGPDSSRNGSRPALAWRTPAKTQLEGPYLSSLSAEGFTDIAGGRAGAEHPGHSEVRLFSILGHWSEAEGRRQQPQVRPENKCKVLGEALALIRFPLMTLEESAAEPAQKGILVDREAGSLFPHLTGRPQPHKDYHPPGALLPLQEGVQQHEQPPAGGEPLGVLSINESIFVVGFGLCGSIHGPTDYHVNIQIIHMDRPRARTTAVSAVRVPPAPSGTTQRVPC